MLYLMSVRAAVADEIDFWSNSGSQVVVDSCGGQVVDLVSQPAVAAVPPRSAASASAGQPSAKQQGV